MINSEKDTVFFSNLSLAFYLFFLISTLDPKFCKHYKNNLTCCSNASASRVETKVLKAALTPLCIPASPEPVGLS